MLTQQMPALAQALTGVLPPAAVTQLMQALGNCQQGLSHRGSATLYPASQPNRNGLVGAGAWNPSQFQGLIPNAGSRVFVDVAGGGGYYDQRKYQGGNWYDGGAFSFPIDAAFTTNNYYGGDTFNVEGSSYFDDSVHLNLDARTAKIQNLFATTINNYPAPTEPPPQDPGGGPGGGGGGPTITPGGPILIPFPAAIQVKSIVTNVRGGVAKAEVMQVNGVKTPVDGLKTTVAYTPQQYEVAVTGNVVVPTAKSATLESLSANGTASVSVPNAATISGIAASFAGTVNAPTAAALTNLAATCSLNASIPTKATISNIAVSSGPVTFNIPTAVTLPAFTGTSSAFNVPVSAAISGIAANASAISVPIANQVVLPNLTSTASINVPSTANITGVTASSSTLSIDIPDSVTLPAFKGSCAAFNLPTSANLSQTGTAQVTITEVTGGYLDANCQLKLTTQQKTYNVTLPTFSVGLVTTSTSPAITVTANGSATLNTSPQQFTPKITVTNNGTITLANSPVTTNLTITPTSNGTLTYSNQSFTPNITITNNGTVTLTNQSVTPNITVSPSGTATLNVTSTSVTPTITVDNQGTVTLNAPSSTLNGTVNFTSNGTISLTNSPLTVNGAVTVTNNGTVTLTNGTQNVSVNVSAANATVNLTVENATYNLSASGNVTVDKTSTVTVNGSQNLTLEQALSEANVPIDRALRVNKDFLIYYRPRF